MTEKLKAHQHVTPRVYLRRFATDGQLIAERPGAEPIPLGVPEVGVRKHFYTVRLQDGSGSNEVENSLSLVENAVAKVFAKVDRGQLPLSITDKAALAEFLGWQMSRGMGYRQMRQEHILQNEPWIREHAKELFLRYASPGRAREAEEYARNYDLGELTRQNVEIEALMSTGHLLANSLVNMQWTFVRFPRPMLLSSDQPVVCWLGPYRSSPWALLPSSEIRVPIDPMTALVATWHDEPDWPTFVPGDSLFAMSVNHFTRRQAVDWAYWQPSTKPRHGLPAHDDGISGPRPEDTQRARLTTDLVTRLLDSRAPGITVFLHTAQLADVKDENLRNWPPGHE